MLGIVLRQGGVLAGGEEDHALRHLHRVVREPLVVATEEGDVDRRRHSPLPLAHGEQGEQVAAEVVDGVVLLGQGGGLLGVPVEQHLGGGPAERDRDPAHLGEVPVDGLREHALRMPPADDLGDVPCQRAHPGEVLDELDGGDHLPEITGDRRLEGQEREPAFLVLGRQPGHLRRGLENPLGGHEVDLEEGVGRQLHVVGGEGAHPGHRGGQIREFFRVDETHVNQHTGMSTALSIPAMNGR